MAKKHFIFRHLAIIKKLKNGPATFESIIKYIEQEADVSFEPEEIQISRRTFQRDCNEIASLWGVEIAFNRSEKKYEIISNEEDDFLERTIESFDLLAALQKKDSIGSYLFLENRKSSGSQYFNGIFHAIQNQLVITFEHYSYWNDVTTQRRCVPKAIKESQNRYYLIAYDLDKKDFRNFGLDRIDNLIITHENNRNTPKIDVKSYYKHTFGIERYGEAEQIILEFDAEQKFYLESLPLHSSQKIISENKETITVELFLHPTHSFVMELLRHGAVCEVKAPETLREILIETIQQMNEKYGI